MAGGVGAHAMRNLSPFEATDSNREWAVMSGKAVPAVRNGPASLVCVLVAPRCPQKPPPPGAHSSTSIAPGQLHQTGVNPEWKLESK